MMVTVVPAVLGAAHAPRLRVSTAEVAQALSARGIETLPKQVALLAEVFAVKGHPELEIRSVRRWDDLRSQVELACHIQGECLPFYVFVIWPDKPSAAEAIRTFQNLHGGEKAPPGLPVPVRVPVRVPVASSMSGDDPAAATAANEISRYLPTLRAGARVLLAIDVDGLRIRVPVTCLERGSVGQKIRVQSRDRKQIYVAEVVDSASVKGTL